MSEYDLVKRLLAEYLKPHIKKIIIATILMIVAAAATAGNAVMVKPMLDEIFVNQNGDLLKIIPLIILALALIKAGSSYGYSLIMKFTGQRIVTDMQIRLYQHLLYADITTFSAKSSGKIISQFTNDIHIIRKDLNQVLSGLANQFFTLIFLIGVMFYQSLELALIGFIVFPVAIYPIIKLGKKMRKTSHKTQVEMEEFTAKLDDTFQAVRVVKAYNNEDFETKNATSIIERIFNLYIRAARIESIASPMMECLAGVAIAAVVWYGGAQVLEGNTTPGSFFSFITALLMAYKPVKSLSVLNANIQEGMAAVKRLYDVLDTKPKIKDADDAVELRTKSASIKFDDVQYSYNEGIKALSSLSLHAKAGQKIALVGNSGGGKSTIINMIMRFYDTDSGSIKISGKDIKNITLKSLRSHIAVVNQEATLFDASIADNIRYSNLTASEDEIIEAAKNAQAHDFIVEQEGGYDAQIGQHGMKLSGGQRQRIAIARAMLSKAPILLLDEATSALDTISEKKVQQALDKLMEGRTTITIAHRLSTVINADVIYVVDKGTVVEKGTHDQLLKLNGAYTKFCKHQLL